MIGKKRSKKGGIPVRVYSPLEGRKVWIGTYEDRESAKEAHRKAEERFARGRRRTQLTVRQWADRWLETYHGPRTQRPEATTLLHNEQAIRAFLVMYGDKRLSLIDGEIAKDFAGEFNWRARVVAAMFNDAVTDGKLDANPFKGIGIKSGPGREDIDPLTTSEVNRLAAIALERLDFYGPHFAAVIITGAWTGVRPGELGGWEWQDFDWETGEARIRRQSRKDRVVPYTKTKDQRKIVLADPAVAAISNLPRMTDYVFSTRRGKRLNSANLGYAWRPVRDAFTAELDASHWLRQRVARDPEDKLDWYELRHHCGSLMALHGANEFEIAEHLGNSPEVCRRTYIHPFKSVVRDRNRDVFRRAVDAGRETFGEQLGSASA